MRTLSFALNLRARAVLATVAGAAAAASLLAVGITTVTTDAAYTDQANVNLTGGSGQGIGVKQNFDIALIARDGTMAQGLSTAPAAMAIDPALTSSLAPGRTLQTSVTAFNNTPRWQAGVGLTVASASTSSMVAHLRFTAVDVATGAVLFGDASDPTKGVSLDKAQGPLARSLAGSGTMPLLPGNATTGIPSAARAEIQLTVAYLDDLTPAEQTSLNGATVPLTVTFTAQKI